MQVPEPHLHLGQSQLCLFIFHQILMSLHTEREQM